MATEQEIELLIPVSEVGGTDAEIELPAPILEIVFLGMNISIQKDIGLLTGDSVDLLSKSHCRKRA